MNMLASPVRGAWLLALAAMSGAVQAGEPEDAKRLAGGRSCFRCDLRYETAIQADLTRIDLRGAYMFNINLLSARLVGAQLESSNLQMANLERADLSQARLDRATLTAANFLGATLIGASMQQVVARGTNFDSTDLSDVDLTTADLQSASFVNAFAEKATFMSADLRRANLKSARMHGAQFVDANLGAGDVYGEFATAVEPLLYGGFLAAVRCGDGPLRVNQRGHTDLAQRPLLQPEHGGELCFTGHVSGVSSIMPYHDSLRFMQGAHGHHHQHDHHQRCSGHF